MTGSFIAPAYAQDIEEANEPSLEEVVVTGSRILRRDLTAPSPIVTIEQQAFERSSTVGIESVLNQLPQFVPGGSGGGPGSGTQFGTGDVQASAFNTPGISTVNLRGLGTNRNLVLMDGRRAQPANATLTVDINTIPSSLIESVEVITGGASAVYGADAVGGVVNFKLKDDFQGFQFDAQTGITQHGDGEETRIGMLFGANSADNRFNVVFGGEWAKRQKVYDRDRKFYRNIWRDPLASGNSRLSGAQYETGGNPPSQAAIDQVFSSYPAGTVPGATGSYFFNSDDTIFVQGGGYGYNGPLNDTFKQLEDGDIEENATYGLLSSPLERYSAFGRGSYALTENVDVFFQGNFSEVQVDQVLQYAPAVSLWNATIPRDADHPIPDGLATLLDSRSAPDDAWNLGMVLDFLGPRRSSNTTTVYQMMTGLKGDLFDTGWTFEVYGSHGQTQTINENNGFASVERWRQIVTQPNYGQNYSFTGPSGTSLSCTSGIPVFDDFEVSQDCIDSISLDMTNVVKLQQDIVEANFQGGLFNLPAGEVRGAVGASYRKNSVQFRPDPMMNSDSVIDQPVGIFAGAATGGSTDVKEIYGEVLVPVLGDIPAIQRLDLELGGRYSDYDTTGGIETYKILGNWVVNEYLSFRGGHQLANRAPNTAELFTGTTLTVSGFPTGDPCSVNTTATWGNVADNANRQQVQNLCSALIGNPGSVFDQDPDAFGATTEPSIRSVEARSGNPDLKEERAKTWTFGAVVSSPLEGALSSLVATVDWYSIKINDAIAPLTSFEAYRQCFNADSTSNPAYDPTNEFCQRIVRDSESGGAIQVEAPYFNLGTIKTSGIDAAVNWNSALEDLGVGLPGRIGLNFQISYLLGYKTQDAPGADFVENKNSRRYEYRTFTTLSYSRDSWSTGLRWRHLPSIKSRAYATNPDTTIEGAPSYDIFDLYGNAFLSDTVSLRFGIDNLFNKQPPRIGDNPANNTHGTNTSAGYYDTLGRRFYAGIKLTY